MKTENKEMGFQRKAWMATLIFLGDFQGRGKS
jgi:hypothetical protein